MIVLLSAFAVAGNAQTNRTFDRYISLSSAGFLPVFTAGVKMNYVFNEWFTWGFGLNSFWTEGYSVNAEAFAKLTPVHIGCYELPVSLGLIAGWANEGSFGLKPRSFWGLGLHLEVTPIVIKTGEWGIEFLTSGVVVITDFSMMKLSGTLSENSGLALSIYLLGVGVRYYF